MTIIAAGFTVNTLPVGKVHRVSRRLHGRVTNVPFGHRDAAVSSKILHSVNWDTGNRQIGNE